MTALLFSFAVHVAKAIGLHQWSSLGHNEVNARNESKEKTNAMYCMLCLSRAVSWASGSPSLMPGVATFERELSGLSDTRSASNLAARVALLQLEEQVYTGLYSDEATHQDAGDIGKKAAIRGRKLQDWAADHSDDLGENQECRTQVDCARDELAIRLSSTQALAAWSLLEDSDTSCSLLDFARRSLQLLRRLWGATEQKRHYLNLAVYVLSYFYEVAAHLSSP